MKKHAYLILAHTNHHQLQQLINILDDEKNDIFMHIDKKSQLSPTLFKVTKSNLFFVPSVDVHWGNITIIEAEYQLFEAAIQSYHYAYYHLISGMDLPLHSQNYIHNFFKKHEGLEFIGFGKKNWNIQERVFCHNFFMKKLRISNKPLRYFYKFLRILLNNIQIYFKLITPNKNYDAYRYGCEWCSVTDNFVRDLVADKNRILSFYKYAYCPDEIYKQTFALNSKYKNYIYDLDDEFHGCLREIDWKRGRPYTWKKVDYEYLASSNKLFARKFDEKVDREIIDLIITKIKNEESQS